MWEFRCLLARSKQEKCSCKWRSRERVKEYVTTIRIKDSPQNSQSPVQPMSWGFNPLKETEKDWESCNSPLSIRDSTLLFYQWRQRYLRTTGWADLTRRRMADGLYSRLFSLANKDMLQYAWLLSCRLVQMRAGVDSDSLKLCINHTCRLFVIEHSRPFCSPTGSSNDIMRYIWRTIIASDAGEWDRPFSMHGSCCQVGREWILFQKGSLAISKATIYVYLPLQYARIPPGRSNFYEPYQKITKPLNHMDR